MFRDFIYLDTDRVQSIIAQLQEGLLSEVIEGKSEETRGRAQMAVNLLMMMLPVRASGSVEQGRATSFSESRVLHDYAFEAARLSLEDEGLLSEGGELDRDEVPETGFVLVRGVARILDYETMSRLSKNYDRLDDFFNSDDTPAQRKKRRKENNPFRDSHVLIETFFEDTIRVKIENAQGCGFVGPLAREHLREDIRELVYKHGSEPEGEWTMLAEVVRVPGPDDDPEQRLGALLGGGQANGGSVSDQLDQVMDLFNAFQEFLGSASYPNVIVSPVALYREVGPRPDN